jgi:purine-nucleoside phosphorylase
MSVKINITSTTPAVKTKPSREFLRAQHAARFILSKTKLRPRIGLILGSGLGAFANDLEGAARIDYSRIPYFPRSTAIGHAGRMVIGEVSNVPVAVMQGRVHFYEGYTQQQVIFPMRVMARMGIRAAVITNAAGGINRDFKQGSLVILSDHINLQGTNPLIGPNDERFGVRFPDMTQVYWKPYQDAALQEGIRLNLEMSQGVYAALPGPSYETPAEIRYLRSIGADLAGMSTAPEVIAAAHLGIRVLGISCVTNMAAGILDQPITTEEVIETGERVKTDFISLLRAVIPRINESLR